MILFQSKYLKPASIIQYASQKKKKKQMRDETISKCVMLPSFLSSRLLTPQVHYDETNIKELQRIRDYI